MGFIGCFETSVNKYGNIPEEQTCQGSISPRRARNSNHTILEFHKRIGEGFASKVLDNVSVPRREIHKDFAVGNFRSIELVKH